MSSLDKYNEAAAAGILSDDSGPLLESLYAERDGYQSEIDSLYDEIDESNRKIAAWRTQKTTASTGYKKTLSSYIAAEQEKITANRAKISDLKDKLSDCNAKIKEVSAYKPASYYINEGVDDSVSYYKDRISSEKSDYGIWYEQNKDTATPQEIAAKYNESVNSQLALQKALVDDLCAAYTLMVELYGEDAAVSRNLEEQLKKERYAYEQLANSYMDMSDAVEEGLEKRTEAYKTDAENARLVNKWWNETDGTVATNAEKATVNTENLNRQLKNQGIIVSETAKAYLEMVRLYGVNSEESKKLENQLISECIAYDTLKNKVGEVNAENGYSREEVHSIVYTMNDYVRDNMDNLLADGFTEEEVYALARQYSGFDDLVDYNNREPVEEAPSSKDILRDIFGDEFADDPTKADERFLDLEEIEKNGTGGGFESVEEALTGIFDAVELFISELSDSLLYNINAGDQTQYTSVYNITTGADASIADQIAEMKKYDAMKKARGIE